MQQDYKPSAGEHPITPPPELVEKWRKEPEYTDCNQLVTMVTMTTDRLMQLCEKSAQYGADQELEAMLAKLKALHLPGGYAARLRAAPPQAAELEGAGVGRLGLDVHRALLD